MTGRIRGVTLAVLGCLFLAPGFGSGQQSSGEPVPTSRAGVGDGEHVPDIFRSGDRCVGCHKGVSTSAGEDVSIGYDWRASMMANSARDPYWQAAVRREIIDHPSARAEIEDKCATCHMPMARTTAHLGGSLGSVFSNLPVGGADGRHADLAADGVSCAVCHQIGAQGLGEPASFTGGFSVDATTPWGRREVFGPFEVDEGRAALMESAVGLRPTGAGHVQSSELCASCHTLYTHALDAQGNEVGELPEQVPYLEWRQSSFPAEGLSCQSCHMPTVGEPVPVTSVLGLSRTNVSRHVFRGGNFFVLGMLARHREELGVEALPQELDAAIRRTLGNLQERTATLTLDASVTERRLAIDVQVQNLAGHKLPTAYPSRRSWLHLVVRDAADRAVFESGMVRANGSISGNDADADPAAYEPHYEVIESQDQVQIYEAVMVDVRNQVTTGLISAVRFVKDNRITPRGFRKRSVPDDVAVQGRAARDGDFVGGSDRVRYEVDVSEARAPYRIEAELRFQPIGYRWARNLDGYDAMETRRFVEWFDKMAAVSSTVLARADLTIAGGEDPE